MMRGTTPLLVARSGDRRAQDATTATATGNEKRGPPDRGAVGAAGQSSGQIIGQVRGGDSDNGAVLEIVAHDLPPGLPRNPHPRRRPLPPARLQERRRALEPDRQAAWRGEPQRRPHGRFQNVTVAQRRDA